MSNLDDIKARIKGLQDDIAARAENKKDTKPHPATKKPQDFTLAPGLSRRIR